MKQMDVLWKEDVEACSCKQKMAGKKTDKVLNGGKKPFHVPCLLIRKKILFLLSVVN